MTTTKKPPTYEWVNGHFSELPFEVIPVPYRGKYIVRWHDFDGRYEYAQSNGYHWDRVWDVEHLPNEFRAHLLLLGIT